MTAHGSMGEEWGTKKAALPRMAAEGGSCPVSHLNRSGFSSCSTSANACVASRRLPSAHSKAGCACFGVHTQRKA